MKSIGGYIFPVLLIILGGIIFVIGLSSGQNMWVKLGSFLTLLTGVIALLLQLGILGRKAGMAIGIAFGLIAVFLAFRNYRSIAEVIEFNERKAAYDARIIQALKDIRDAQSKYKEANNAYTGNLAVLRDFVKNGTYPMVRKEGQVPDTLTELQALQMGIIVRDTIRASVLDSVFRTARALEKRVYPFNPDSLGFSPVSGKPFLLTAGMINSSGRNVPVMLCKDPSPMVAGDTLLFGSMEKATVAGNWKGD
ncbi:MAG: hypothetical protein QY325_08335 [Flavobacteriales bacterium]|nr:MAG: hypothetical protein QY325_08335 [Flavobacteriales bacterium]